MVEAFFQPLNIFLIGLGGGFLIPLLYRIAKPLPAIGFVAALCGSPRSLSSTSGGFTAAAPPLK